MPTLAENLQAAKTNYAAQLADISANPKPSYSVGGRSFSWTEYQRFLIEQMSAIDIQLATDSTSEVYTEGFSE